MAEPRFDFAVIGAGMAGASLAAELAPHARVLILEAEAHPGYHATGRSAAFWCETYGGPEVAPLTRASHAALEGGGFLRPRGCLHIADAAGEEALDALLEAFPGALEPLGRARLEAIVPGLGRAVLRGAAEPSCADIDVAALHAHALARARGAGAELRTDAPVTGLEPGAHGWQVRWPGGSARADTLINAAGAWADQVAERAGVRPLELQPYRRTMAQVRTDPPARPDLPLVVDARGRFYFKAEAGGRLWVTPHDEIPSAPVDAAAEEADVALAVARVEGAVSWRVTQVERRWAGLRTFAPDRLPVYGRDARQPGFFWFAGQGGFGIQTAPAAARIAGALLLGQAPDPADREIDPARYAPSRFG